MRHSSDVLQHSICCVWKRSKCSFLEFPAPADVQRRGERILPASQPLQQVSPVVLAAGKSTAGGPLQVACVEHPKVVNSASFSPITGQKLMTTCIDNRIRVWDYLLAIDGPPSQEIVHSHDFNRYLTPFRAEWDPKDPAERLIAIGRYAHRGAA